MSETYLVLALTSTFVGVGMLTAVAIGTRQRHRRAAHVLEAQLGSVDYVVDLKQEELNRSLTQRLILPALSSLGAVARRLTSEDMRVRPKGGMSNG
jgi:hypothetical protein